MNVEATSHAIHRVEHFEIVGPYTMALRFEDGTRQRIDFRAVLEGGLLGPLQDSQVFNAVVLDQDAGTLVWPNGADFDPATLYDWPKVQDQFVAMARGLARRSSAVESCGLTRHAADGRAEKRRAAADA